MKWPTLQEIEGELVSIKKGLEKGQEIEVRLQVLEEGTWQLNEGDPQYDTDHRGFWGSATLTPKSSCRSIARDLLAEAKESEAVHQVASEELRAMGEAPAPETLSKPPGSPVEASEGEGQGEAPIKVPELILGPSTRTVGATREVGESIRDFFRRMARDYGYAPGLLANCPQVLEDADILPELLIPELMKEICEETLPLGKQWAEKQPNGGVVIDERVWLAGRVTDTNRKPKSVLKGEMKMATATTMTIKMADAVNLLLAIKLSNAKSMKVSQVQDIFNELDTVAKAEDIKSLMQKSAAAAEEGNEEQAKKFKAAAKLLKGTLTALTEGGTIEIEGQREVEDSPFDLGTPPEEAIEAPKKKRGRPARVQETVEEAGNGEETPKKKRGRPAKVKQKGTEEVESPKKRGRKAKVEQAEAEAPKKRGKKEPGELSNKGLVYTSWKASKEKKEPADLFKEIGEGVKEATIRGWISAWKRGQNLPAVAK